MAIRSQILTRDVLTIVGPDGTVHSVTKEQVQAFYQTTSGNAANRRQQVITWFNNNMVAALGSANVNPAELLLNFDVVDGGFTQAEWRAL